MEKGKAPRALLAVVPLFKGGGHRGIIPRCKGLAQQEPDVELRPTLGLAAVFADAAGCGDLWREALKEWDMVESQTFNEWVAFAEKRGGIKGKVEALLRMLRRFAPLPADLDAKIRACNDAAQLEAWIDAGVAAKSLDDFRREAGL